MSGKPDKQSNWGAFAADCGFRVRQIAKRLGISVRWLEYEWQEKFGKSPHALCVEWRLEIIQKLAWAGVGGKQIAKAVGFSSYGNLCRSVKQDAGLTLKELSQVRAGRSAQNENKKSWKTTVKC